MPPEVLRSAALGLGTTLILGISIALGSRKLAHFDAALVGYARAVMRVQAWLSRTPPAVIAERLPESLVAGSPERFVDRFGALQAAYAPGGEATEAGLAASLRVLRGGSPWPVSVEVRPSDLREPAAVGEARAALGPQPADP